MLYWVYQILGFPQACAEDSTMTDDTGGRIWVNAVHYDKSTLAEAQRDLEGFGFQGIRDLSKGDAVDCNEARKEVKATEAAGGHRWWYSGPRDYNLGTPCRIYTFSCDVIPDSRG